MYAKNKEGNQCTLDFWDGINEETPPLPNPVGSNELASTMTLEGSSGRMAAMTKKAGTDLDMIAPLFFTNS